MKKFDQYLKQNISEEQENIPGFIQNQIEDTLDRLPEMSEKKVKKRQTFRFYRIAAALAGLAVIMLFVLPNVSEVYARTLEKVPIIGELVRVITIRNYSYMDENHEMSIQVPQIEDEKTFASVNQEIAEMSDALRSRFYEDLDMIGDEGHSSLYVDYEVVTNTKNWFTLKIQVVEAAGSGNVTYQFYHLNKITGEIVTLKDIVADQNFYQIVEQNVEQQMLEAMKDDSNLRYWVQDKTFGDCVSIDEQHNFYWNKDGNLVIPFDKYEVAPGYMGTPEFVIDRDEITDCLKDSYKDVIE